MVRYANTLHITIVLHITHFYPDHVVTLDIFISKCLYHSIYIYDKTCATPSITNYQRHNLTIRNVKMLVGLIRYHKSYLYACIFSTMHSRYNFILYLIFNSERMMVDTMHQNC